MLNFLVFEKTSVFENSDDMVNFSLSKKLRVFENSLLNVNLLLLVKTELSVNLVVLKKNQYLKKPLSHKIFSLLNLYR